MTESFRINFEDSGKTISPWHDIPLKNGELFNFVNEIPKYTKAKMEVSTKEENNPIAQDMKKGKLRDYHGPIFWCVNINFEFNEYLFLQQVLSIGTMDACHKHGKTQMWNTHKLSASVITIPWM